MQWTTTSVGIIGIEVGIFIILLLIYLFRPRNAKQVTTEVDKLTSFLDKADEESLIKLTELEHREVTRTNTLHRNVEKINRLLTDRPEATSADLGHLSKEYLKVIKAVDAIHLREIERLKQENKHLKRRHHHD